MIYPDLKFPTKTDRPFFFTNFVSTVDGKVQILNSEQGSYWPIGSETDFQTLLELRAYSDIFIHGKKTALGFNHLKRIHSPEFREIRKKLGKEGDVQYMIITNHPDDTLLEFLKETDGDQAYLVTNELSTVSAELDKHVIVIRLGRSEVDLNLLSSYLQEHKFNNVLVEGGPTLLGSFLKEDLLDEVFLTIAPKIFGNEDKMTLNLVEGILFPPDKIKNLKLISVKQVEDELYLRYSIK